jgi:hypothetical protein
MDKPTANATTYQLNGVMKLLLGKLTQDRVAFDKLMRDVDGLRDFAEQNRLLGEIQGVVFALDQIHVADDQIRQTTPEGELRKSDEDPTGGEQPEAAEHEEPKGGLTALDQGDEAARALGEILARQREQEAARSKVILPGEGPGTPATGTVVPVLAVGDRSPNPNRSPGAPTPQETPQGAPEGSQGTPEPLLKTF